MLSLRYPSSRFTLCALALVWGAARAAGPAAPSPHTDAPAAATSLAPAAAPATAQSPSTAQVPATGAGTAAGTEPAAPSATTTPAAGSTTEGSGPFVAGDIA